MKTLQKKYATPYMDAIEFHYQSPLLQDSGDDPITNVGGNGGFVIGGGGDEDPR